MAITADDQGQRIRAKPARLDWPYSLYHLAPFRKNNIVTGFVPLLRQVVIGPILHNHITALERVYFHLKREMAGYALHIDLDG